MVGLDIGTKTIKILELEKRGSGWVLNGAGVVGYSGTPPENCKDDVEFRSIADIIRKLHKDAKISKKDVVISLPESQVFTRTIHFPLLTDQEITSAVKWEAEQYVPIPINEAVVQHEILERRDNATPPEVLVLLVAAPEALVEKYLRVMQLSGLTTIAAESELIALVRSLAPENQTSLVMDFGAHSTDIAVARNSRLVFSRSLPSAGEALTRAITQNLGIEPLQAEEYKKTYGLSSSQLEGKVKTALEPVINMITDEVKKAIHFYQTEEKGEVPKSVIISGGTAGLPEIVPYLSKGLNIEVVMGNPFDKISLSPETAKSLANYAPLYSIAAGLAMRGD